MTSAALSPTGAFKHASDFFIESSVESGNALPVFCNAASPASSSSTESFTPNLSLTVSKILAIDSDISGPIPSPVIKEIRYIVFWVNFVFLAFFV